MLDPTVPPTPQPPVGVRVRRCDDPLAASGAAAEHLIARLQQVPNAVLALPTGQTPVPFYAALLQAQRDGRVDLDRIQVFALDEYLGLAPTHEHSFAHFLQQHFVTPAGLRPEQVHLLDGSTRDPERTAREYEARLADLGGLDVAVLGIGGNGHIAFNEPPSAATSRTRVVALHPATRAANAGAFAGRIEAVPTHAITMGVATLLEAQTVLWLAFGASKRAILQAALRGPCEPACPASFLQEHPSVYLFADSEALGDAPQP